MMTTKTGLAQRLRRNQTDAERLLWFRLRDRRSGLRSSQAASNGLGLLPLPGGERVGVRGVG
jgi:Protein of unknown function (DUF559)